MKILSFGHIPSWAGGRQESGLANVMYNLAKNMSEVEGVSVSLAATDVFGRGFEDGSLDILGWTKKDLLAYGVTRPVLSFKILSGLLSARKKYGFWVDVKSQLFKSLFLMRSIDRTRPDILHLHGAMAVLYLDLVPAEVKVVVTVHGLVGDEASIKGSARFAVMEKDMCGAARISRMFFISSKLIDDFTLKYGKICAPAEAIVNAYNDSFFSYIEPEGHGKLTLATIASMNELKGQERVLHAIGESGADIKYVCIGMPDEEIASRMRSYASSRGIELEILGKQAPGRIRELLAAVDYMILPSSSEGFGLVFLEAMACGVPVILPKNLPIVAEKDIIRPGENAILLEDCSEASIAGLLPSLTSGTFDRKNVAGMVSRFNWRNISAKYIERLKTLNQ